MIPRIAPFCQTPSWQKQLNNAIRCPTELLRQLKLPDNLLAAAQESAKLFPLKVTHHYLTQIEKGNVNDPLLRQILPLIDEQQPHPDYCTDPVGDLKATPVPGIIHKYRGRALLMATPSCGIHCRYCFRRHFPYSTHKSSNNWRQAIEYIHKDPSIHEVILSGGDPLSLSNNKLFRLMDLLEAIPHIKRIRIHTRYPIILPDRIDRELSDYLHQHHCKIVMVIHSNHPNELDTHVGNALKLLNNNEITLLNQSVLLAGVNDNVATLSELSEQLFMSNVLPYYLHQLDKVQGAQHFAVNDSRAKVLIKMLRKQLPGYLVPLLVRENSGEPSKQPIMG
ncbi:Lysine 2,3-aminomutase [hydrothermal vent metagenome]|uniref:L-lysine 2,3-aminomutase n=1 Tax=hydrothermal vent metagenome TaxID=652676 RepID=A0A3B1A8S0_9ZZZZ